MRGIWIRLWYGDRPKPEVNGLDRGVARGVERRPVPARTPGGVGGVAGAIPSPGADGVYDLGVSGVSGGRESMVKRFVVPSP